MPFALYHTYTPWLPDPEGNLWQLPSIDHFASPTSRSPARLLLAASILPIALRQVSAQSIPKQRSRALGGVLEEGERQIDELHKSGEVLEPLPQAIHLQLLQGALAHPLIAALGGLVNPNGGQFRRRSLSLSVNRPWILYTPSLAVHRHSAGPLSQCHGRRLSTQQTVVHTAFPPTRSIKPKAQSFTRSLPKQLTQGRMTVGLALFHVTPWASRTRQHSLSSQEVLLLIGPGLLSKLEVLQQPVALLEVGKAKSRILSVNIVTQVAIMAQQMPQLYDPVLFFFRLLRVTEPKNRSRQASWPNMLELWLCFGCR